MWATRSVVQAGVELVGNPAPGGLSINPCPRHIHGRDYPASGGPAGSFSNLITHRSSPYGYNTAELIPQTHPIMSRWVNALTFLRSVLGISGDSLKL